MTKAVIGWPSPSTPDLRGYGALRFLDHILLRNQIRHMPRLRWVVLSILCPCQYFLNALQHSAVI
jgi:hypothetical protein